MGFMESRYLIGEDLFDDETEDSQQCPHGIGFDEECEECDDAVVGPEWETV